MGYARRIISQLLRIQSNLMDDDLRSSIADDSAVGYLRIYCEDDELGNDEIYLMLENGFVKEINAPRNIKHSIEMHIDTFLDIFTGELDFGEAWAKNLIRVEGEKKTLHIARWIKWIRRMKDKIKEVSI